MARRPVEPFLWLLFSAGGVLSALLIPALLFLFGVAFPLGWMSPPDHGRLTAVLGHPVTRVVLLGLCVLALFHWAHRFRYALHHGLQLRHLERAISLACYGGALAGSAVAGYLLLSAW
ncbi:MULTISPECIES: fumarate reductase subunit FrdD [Streptosporangium]|uniref:Fumarate reductase subunit D n=1 Tax=Streptosporangium brasiliense TaxID=47480 RepID=A0ABT9R3P2_9ACTN|nr:fumarate reductase subunit FrdD [Streptosporangium brasiliense]MDP9863837.1 fumarate reductase subunit D [Streptosporangium brasiliense]